MDEPEKPDLRFKLTNAERLAKMFEDSISKAAGMSFDLPPRGFPPPAAFDVQDTSESHEEDDEEDEGWVELVPIEDPTIDARELVTSFLTSIAHEESHAAVLGGSGRLRYDPYDFIDQWVWAAKALIRAGARLGNVSQVAFLQEALREAAEHDLQGPDEDQ